MPKGRRGGTHAHSNKKKLAANSSAVADANDDNGAELAPTFTSTCNGPLLTLLFDSARAQHDALARVESYYESPEARYRTLEEARTMKLCKNYEAFNLPIDVMRQWLAEMQSSEQPLSEARTPAVEGKDGHSTEREVDQWWLPFCNRAEIQLLSQLDALGCLQPLAKGHEEPEQGTRLNSAGHQGPTYLISALNSQSTASLAHESLHALYFLHEAYRERVSQLYEQDIPRKMQSIIEHDLSMRGYDRRVWLDEFQAYVSNDAGEFGAKPREACTEVRKQLRELQKQCWAETGLHV